MSTHKPLTMEDIANMSELDKMKTDGLSDYEKLLWIKRGQRMAAKTTISAAELLAEDDLEKFASIIEVADHLTTHHAYIWLDDAHLKNTAKNLAHMNQLHEMAHNESEGYC